MELSDPTLSQPTCSECGLPIRSDTFELHTPLHTFHIKTPGGIITRYVSGIPSPIRRQVNQWRHDDPRASFDHPAEPFEFTSHDADFERQERNWRLEELEKKAHLGRQFRDG